MTKTICRYCCITTSVSLSAQTLKPITTNIGKLSISIDPRMELLGTIQTIADYPIMTKDTPYSDEIKEYFAQMKDSRATLLTKELYNYITIASDMMPLQLLCCTTLNHL